MAHEQPATAAATGDKETGSQQFAPIKALGGVLPLLIIGFIAWDGYRAHRAGPVPGGEGAPAPANQTLDGEGPGLFPDRQFQPGRPAADPGPGRRLFQPPAGPPPGRQTRLLPAHF